MKDYKIILEGKGNKVLVVWERPKNSFYPNGKEYSVHTLTNNDELIWGHYFTDKRQAILYFKEVAY